MDATLTDRSPRWTARPGAVFLVETLALFAVLAAPYFILDYGWSFIANAVFMLGYILWPRLASWRKRKTATEPAVKPKGPPIRVFLLVLGFQCSVLVIATGVTATIVVGWMTWAYWIELVPGGAPLMVWAIPGILVLAPVLFLALARPRGKGTPANDFLAAVRSKGLAPFRESWLITATFFLAFFCLLLLSVSIPAFHQILRALKLGEELAVWELALVFPFIPLGLIAIAAMLSIHRMIGHGRNSPGAIVEAYAREPADSLAPASRTGAFGGFAVTCAWVATLYAILYPIHFGMVAALSSVVSIAPSFATQEAVETWVEEQRAEGRTGAELAAILNEHGSWSADSPEAGLPVLFPDLKDSLPVENTSGLGSCGITLAAGVADPAAVSGVDWLEPEQAGSDLRYCIRTACPSPVSWDAPDTIILQSSHSSQNKYWLQYLFIDVFANGRAPAPGGYCTATGDLADSFQG